MELLYLLLLNLLLASSTLIDDRFEEIHHSVGGDNYGIPTHLPEDDYESLVSQQFSKDPYAGKNKIKLIVSGKFKLIDVTMVGNHEVMGSFCEFYFDETTNILPRYVDYYSESIHCQEHHVSLPLHKVAEACRKYDSTGTSKMMSMEPDGFILHQPKSGSTLLSNILAVSSRVIAEPSALGDILLCENNCDTNLRIRALQDAMYLLGRRRTTTSMQQKFFVKISYYHTNGLPLLRETFPDANWLYLYRQNDVVLQKLMNSKYDGRYCSRHRFHPEKQLVNYLNKGDDASSLTIEEACAAHFASQMTMIQNELTKDNKGRIVEYNELLRNKSIVQLLNYLEVPIVHWDKIQEQRTKKANGLQQGEEWMDESELFLSKEVTDATSRFNFDWEDYKSMY